MTIQIRWNPQKCLGQQALVGPKSAHRRAFQRRFVVACDRRFLMHAIAVAFDLHAPLVHQLERVQSIQSRVLCGNC
jgi:hypothetical protein